MGRKIKGMGKRVKQAEDGAEQLAPRDEQQTEKELQAGGELSRAKEFRAMAKRLQSEAMLLEAAATAGEKRASTLLE